MNFAIQADGAAAAGQGIGNLFKTMALSDLYRQNAYDKSALQAAHLDAYQAQAAKLLSEAGLNKHRLALQQDPLKDVMIQNQVPLDKRALVEQFINSGSFGPTYETPADGVGPVPQAPIPADTMGLIARGLSLYNRTIGTNSKVDDMAKAGQLEKETADRQDIISGKAQALPVSQAYFATSGKAPFDDVGTTGYAINGLTGGISEGNGVLARLFGQQQGALTNQRNAAAGASSASASLSNARRDRVSAGLDKPQTILDEDTGLATLITLPTAGGTNTVGVAVPKGTGVDATNAKARNAIIAAVEKDLPGASEQEISAEVEKRLARRGLSANKNPGGSGNGSKIPAKDPAALDKARAAIASGAPRDAVIKRLKDNGIDTTGL